MTVEETSEEQGCEDGRNCYVKGLTTVEAILTVQQYLPPLLPARECEGAMSVRDRKSRTVSIRFKTEQISSK